MNDSKSSMSHLQELETLTRDYARYSRSAGGLAAVLGGICCLVSYLAGGLLAPSNSLRVLLIALPLLWLLTKQWIASRYYQRYGHVEEQPSRTERITHAVCTFVVFLVAASITAGLASSATWPMPAGVIGYLGIIWLLLPATWFFLRSPQDFIIGTFLFCQAAVICVGLTYPVIGTHAAANNVPMALLALLFPLIALLMIRTGIVDHRRFIALNEKLSQLHAADSGE